MISEDDADAMALLGAFIRIHRSRGVAGCLHSHPQESWRCLGFYFYLRLDMKAISGAC